jgi:DNA-directed RNA polymerase subunit RPC12/RpoP
MIKKLKKSKIFITFMVLLLVLPSVGLAQRYSQTGSKREMSPEMKSALRSLLFPGLGQLNNGQETKAYIFMGVGAALLGTTIYMGISQNNLWKDYESSLTKSDYDAYKSRVHTANIFIGITSAFWAYNVVDAYLGAKEQTSSSRGYGLRRSVTSIEDESAEEFITCPNCGAKLKPGTKFCPECGAKIESPKSKAEEFITCPNCGAKLKPGTKFCPECGKKIK